MKRGNSITGEIRACLMAASDGCTVASVRGQIGHDTSSETVSMMLFELMKAGKATRIKRDGDRGYRYFATGTVNTDRRQVSSLVNARKRVLKCTAKAKPPKESHVTGRKLNSVTRTIPVASALKPAAVAELTHDKTAIRDRINDDIAAFLAAGGKVMKVETDWRRIMSRELKRTWV